MMLVEDGVLDLDAPVAQYIPAFGGQQVAVSENRNAAGGFDARAPKNQLLVRHLLMFSSGIGPGIEPDPSDLHKYWEDNTIYRDTPESLAQRIDKLAALPLFEEPGTQWRYGWSADVLARVVEVAAQQPYGEFVQARILTPLGMTNTEYQRADGLPDGTATVYTQDENGDLIVSTPSFDAYWTPGGSGLISTAPDYLRFALMLWNGGEYQGVRLLQKATIAEMTKLHMPKGVFGTVGVEGVGWGLGMAVTADGDTATLPSKTGDFYWSGYFGTIFFVSPTTGQVGVILSQNEPQGITKDGVGGPIPVYIAQAIAHAGAPR
jgi:CubicO group peptidase (beta-lactamase class C family)